MKKLILLLFILSSSWSQALNIPSSVFRMENLDEARAEAAAKGKPLCFLYTSEGLKPS